MKRFLTYALAVVFLLFAAVAIAYHQGSDSGRAQGYSTGYSTGYAKGSTVAEQTEVDYFNDGWNTGICGDYPAPCPAR